MKWIIIVLSFVFVSDISAQTNGFYQCQDQVPQEICPQKVQIQYHNGEVDTMSITYSGNCADDGPYFYICDGKVCENGGITITWKNATEYIWNNFNAGFQCTFSKN